MAPHVTRAPPIYQRTIAFIDPPLPDNPSWPLRNLLAYLRALHPSSTQLQNLSWRDAELPSSNGTWKSRFDVLSTAVAEGNSEGKPNAVRRTCRVNLGLGLLIWRL
jgi:ubiquitin-like modifier-activating enzyme ATG7